MVWSLLFSICAIYLLFPTRNYYWDGITFSLSIENASQLDSALIHPHHLLYNVLGYLVYRLANIVGLHSRAVNLLAFFNSVLSALCGLLLFRFLQRTLRSVYLSAVLLLAFSFSATWWKYSVDADAYIPSVFLLVSCLYLLFEPRIKPFAIAILHTGAMCMHQLAVFFYPVVVAGILLNQDYRPRDRMKLLAKYSLSAAIPTLLLNYLCFHAQTNAYGLAQFGRWLTSYVHVPYVYDFSFDALSNLGFTLRGQIRLFFEGRLKWSTGLLSIPIILLITGLACLVALLLWRVFRWMIIHRCRITVSVPFSHKRLLAVCLVWIGSFVTFLFFWYPYFTPYRLFYLPPIICLVAIFLADRAKVIETKEIPAIVILTAAMMISNFVFFIYPLSYVDKYPPLQFALNLNNHWSANSQIYFAQTSSDNQLVQYFNPSTTWRQLDQDFSTAKFENDINELYLQRKSAWLDSSAIDLLSSSSDNDQWLKNHTRPACKHELIARGYYLKFVQVFPESLQPDSSRGCN